MGIDYETYSKERSILIDAEQAGAKSFDKSVLTLSAGSFGLTITFITKMVSVVKLWTIWLLVFTWIFFVFSIFSTLFSFLLSQASCRRQREILDEALKDDFDSSKYFNKPALWTCRLNVASIIFFVLGALFLVTFSANNLKVGGDEMTLKGKRLDNGFSAQKVPQTVPLKEGFMAQKVPANNVANNQTADVPVQKGFVAPQAPKPVQGSSGQGAQNIDNSK